MKKLIIISILFLTIIISGCSCNKAIIDFDYKYDIAYVNEKGSWQEYKIEKWADYDNDTVCIWTTDGKVILTSFNNVILYGKR